MSMNNELDLVVDNIGRFIEYWGFRKIHGKVWGLVYLCSEPISTPDIVSKLGVSKALVSGAINDLLKYKLIEKVGQVKHGGYTYVSTRDLAGVVREVIKNRELILLEEIENDLTVLGKLPKSDKDKLGVSHENIDLLKKLTKEHRKMASRLSKLKLNSLMDWHSFIKKVVKFL
jgi:DNA-binding transcriptional regulator GbsR (MarR family)